MEKKAIKVLSVFGTRPEAIKMAPLVKELESRAEFDSVVCVTAQHREMLDSVLDCFSIVPDYDLDIMQSGQTLPDISSRVLCGLDDVLHDAKPDIVLVHGDTTSAFSSALGAFYAKIPVGHVEAGLRTYDRYSPFPEEMNRCLIGRLAEYHFSPTRQNAENLLKENVSGKIFVSGNTVIDAMKYTVGDGKFYTPELKDIDFDNKRIITLTCHRRENYGKPMENIFSAVRLIAENHKDVEIVYPVHLSPYIRETANKFLSGITNIKLIAPLDAVEMHRLMAKSYLVMTDSGGIQEEAPALAKPVIVLRRETERPEAVEAGTVKLAGVDKDTIYELTEQLLNDELAYESMSKAINPYGDGNACKRIADALLYCFGRRSEPPEEFQL